MALRVCLASLGGILLWNFPHPANGYERLFAIWSIADFGMRIHIPADGDEACVSISCVGFSIAALLYALCKPSVERIQTCVRVALDSGAAAHLPSAPHNALTHRPRIQVYGL